MEYDFLQLNFRMGEPNSWCCSQTRSCWFRAALATWRSKETAESVLRKRIVSFTNWETLGLFLNFRSWPSFAYKVIHRTVPFITHSVLKWKTYKGSEHSTQHKCRQSIGLMFSHGNNGDWPGTQRQGPSSRSVFPEKIPSCHSNIWQKGFHLSSG